MKFNRPTLKTIVLLLIGIFLAVTLSALITFPYILALYDLDQQREETNILQLAGQTHMESQPDSYVNVTLVAVYPRAAVETRSGIFDAHLVFYIVLNPNITDFICDEIEVDFRNSDSTQTYLKSEDLFLSDETRKSFSRNSTSGKIQPFLANISMSIDSERWPPYYGNTSDLLYLAGRVETLPNARLAGRITVNNESYGFFSVLFDSDKCAITIYRFNFPPTLWLTYGVSVIVIVAVSLNSLRQSKKKTTAINTP